MEKQRELKEGTLIKLLTRDEWYEVETVDPDKKWVMATGLIGEIVIDKIDVYTNNAEIARS
jgi:hypothetical protein